MDFSETSRSEVVAPPPDPRYEMTRAVRHHSARAEPYRILAPKWHGAADWGRRRENIKSLARAHTEESQTIASLYSVNDCAAELVCRWLEEL